MFHFTGFFFLLLHGLYIYGGFCPLNLNPSYIFILYNITNMEKASLIYSILSKYKYLITVIIGIIVVGFADSNSIYRRMVLYYEIEELKSEIDYYNNIYKSDASQLRDLERDPRNIERVARERYFMKADDEDIYVLSSDPHSVGLDISYKENGHEKKQ